jgi:hypothetical protein
MKAAAIREGCCRSRNQPVYESKPGFLGEVFDGFWGQTEVFFANFAGHGVAVG